MKKSVILLIIVIFFTSNWIYADNVKEAYGVISRTLGYFPKNVKLISISQNKVSDRYIVYAKDGILYIEGTSVVAICRGFYEYVSQNGYGVCTWSGSRFEIPQVFSNCERKEVVSPFKHHLYMNVCTFGYTSPFWDWKRWEKELDWMALHGFDMPLAPIAHEAILARVWKDMGLTDEEINTFFSAPAHLPWVRMGNMSGIDGAPTEKWHKDQISLQHKILKRMRDLGMKPICQGFAGFVPPAMKTHFPNVNLTETKWSGMKSWMLSPMDSLFTEIGERYIRAWEKEFGKCNYYLIDSFNEMEIPFGKKGSLERFNRLQLYGKTIYHSLSRANPDAVWVMQGWMFGYQRNIWDPESARALLSGAPEGKMLILDLAVDFNHYVWRTEKSWDYLSGLFNREWIYSTVPNFGGRTALIGAMDFYANGHLRALRSKNCGRLVGYGTSPEGIENNDVIYEIIATAGWSDEEIDVSKFLHQFTKARYGKVPIELDKFWEEMRKASYGEFTNNARFRWQVRPGYHRMPTMGINEHYYKAIEYFLSCAADLKDSDLYCIDAIQYGALYLAAKADLVLEAIHWAYMQNRDEEARFFEQCFFELLENIDRLLVSHPIYRMEKWVGQAYEAGCTKSEKERNIKELKRLVTIWGTGLALNDYGARVWSGLIRDFYIPRWKNYFSSMHNRRPFNFKEWDKEFCASSEVSSVIPFIDPLKEVQNLVKKASTLTERIVTSSGESVAYWSPMDFNKSKIAYKFTIGYKDFERMNSIRLSMLRGVDSLVVDRIVFNSNHKIWAEVKPQKTLNSMNSVLEIKVDKKDILEIPLAKEVNVTIYFENKIMADSFGSIEIL